MVAWGFKPTLSNFRASALNHYSADSIDQACGFLVRSADINSAFLFSWTASPIVSFGNDFLCWLFLFSVVVRLRNQQSGLLWLSSSQVVIGSLSFALLCLTTFWFLTSYWNQNLWYGDKKLLKKMEGIFFFFHLCWKASEWLSWVCFLETEPEVGVLVCDLFRGVLCGETCKEVREVG